MPQIDEYAVLQEKYCAAQIEVEAAQAKLFTNLGGRVLQDGNMFGALIGDNLQEGCAAFEDTRWGALFRCLENYRFEKPSVK